MRHQTHGHIAPCVNRSCQLAQQCARHVHEHVNGVVLLGCAKAGASPVSGKMAWPNASMFLPNEAA